jgi:16S rRNA (cytosine967-C5)-methyltransferase
LLAVHELAPQAGETVLDLCAAPGGKLTYIAQIMANQGRINAYDADANRLKLAEQNCGRLGVTCVQPVLREDSQGSENAFGSAGIPHSVLRAPHFDRVLVDAPCSNTGVMRRRVDLRWRVSPAEVERLSRLQLNLLALAAAALKPGGVVVYSTCSLEPEENRDVIGAFLANHPEYQRESERELLPFKDELDGAYVARLRRT